MKKKSSWKAKKSYQDEIDDEQKKKKNRRMSHFSKLIAEMDFFFTARFNEPLKGVFNYANKTDLEKKLIKASLYES